MGRLLVIVKSPIATLVCSNVNIKWKNLIELNKSLVQNLSQPADTGKFLFLPMLSDAKEMKPCLNKVLVCVMHQRYNKSTLINLLTLSQLKNAYDYIDKKALAILGVQLTNTSGDDDNDK